MFQYFLLLPPCSFFIRLCFCLLSDSFSGTNPYSNSALFQSEPPALAGLFRGMYMEVNHRKPAHKCSFWANALCEYCFCVMFNLNHAAACIFHVKQHYHPNGKSKQTFLLLRSSEERSCSSVPPVMELPSLLLNMRQQWVNIEVVIRGMSKANRRWKCIIEVMRSLHSNV